MCREKKLFLRGLGIGLLAISSAAFADSNSSNMGSNPGNTGNNSSNTGSNSSSTGSTTGSNSSNMGSNSAPEFNKVDKDGDGFITISEAKEVKGLPEIYGQVDANADGKLTKTEFSAAVKKQSVAP